MLTYLIGMTRAGKTTYSKITAQRYGFHHFSFDDHWDYRLKADNQWNKFITSVQAAIDQYGDVIIDGMMGSKDVLLQLHKAFPNAQPLIIYTDFATVQSRVDPDRIRGWTETSLKDAMTSYYKTLVDYHPSFILGGNGGFTLLSPHQLFTLLGDSWAPNMEKWLIDHIDSLKCDPKYSPLKLGNTTRPGYERALETLNKIKGLVAWENAHVLEYGPHLAYAALHFYGDLANNVQLVERSSIACKCISKMVNFLGKHNITVTDQNMMDYKIVTRPDIVLCLNMFYAVKDKRAGALKLWEQNPSHIIVETNEQDFQFLNEVAQEKGYKKNIYQGRTNCSGNNRLIGHYTKD